MKKKLLAILAAVVAVSPLAVKAANIDYSIGTEHNFIVNKTQEDKHKNGNETVGVKIISLGDNGDEYIKALAVGATSWIYGPAADIDHPDNFRKLINYTTMIDDLNGNVGDSLPKFDPFDVSTPYVKNFNTDSSNINVMTKDEVLEWFGYTENADGSYKLTDVNKFAKWFTYPLAQQKAYNDLLKAALDDALNNGTITQAQYDILLAEFAGTELRGFFTSSYDSSTEKIWVVDVTYNGSQISDVIVKEINATTIDSKVAYMTVPILYFNKTYDCKYEKVDKSACYKCDDKYQWLVVGQQASTCTIVSGVTSKAKCTDNPKTGVEDYILEFAVAAGICGIVLFAVKRKSLFTRV